MVSICMDTMKLRQVEQDLDDKVVTSVGHHTRAAILHHRGPLQVGHRILLITIFLFLPLCLCCFEVSMD
jgi:hypothetical protein